MALPGPRAPPDWARVEVDELQVRPHARGSHSGTAASRRVSGACPPSRQTDGSSGGGGPGPAPNARPSQARRTQLARPAGWTRALHPRMGGGQGDRERNRLLNRDTLCCPGWEERTSESASAESVTQER